MAEYGKYMMVLSDWDEHIIRSSPKKRHEFQTMRWMRQQPEYYCAADRQHPSAYLWECDGKYRFRTVIFKA